MVRWRDQGVGKVAEVMGRWSVAGMKQGKLGGEVEFDFDV